MEFKSRCRKYNKIGYAAKATLINLITIEGKNIKVVDICLMQAASITGINYSTAKTILMGFRRKLRKLKRANSSTLANTPTTSTTSSTVHNEPCRFRECFGGVRFVEQIACVGGKRELPDRRARYRECLGRSIEVVSTTGLQEGE